MEGTVAIFHREKTFGIYSKMLAVLHVNLKGCMLGLHIATAVLLNPRERHDCHHHDYHCRQCHTCVNRINIKLVAVMSLLVRISETRLLN